MIAFAGVFAARFGRGREDVDAPVQRPAEADLLGLDHGRDMIGPLADFREGVAEHIDDHGNELVEERLVQVRARGRTARPGGGCAE